MGHTPCNCHLNDYPVARRERFGGKGIHIPYIFPIQWGAHAELQIEFPNHLIDEDHGEGKNPDRN